MTALAILLFFLGGVVTYTVMADEIAAHGRAGFIALIWPLFAVAILLTAFEEWWDDFRKDVP